MLQVQVVQRHLRVAVRAGGQDEVGDQAPGQEEVGHWVGRRQAMGQHKRFAAARNGISSATLQQCTALPPSIWPLPTLQLPPQRACSGVSWPLYTSVREEREQM